jgi:hypothetical protein
MQKILLTLAIILLIASANAVAHGQSKPILSRAGQYSAAFKKFQSQKGRRSIEPLIKKGTLVSDKLEDIESLDEGEYAKLKSRMKGYAVNSEEILFIEPDVDYFVKLANKRGTKTDIAFFAFLKRLKPDSVWPAYIEQETDFGGCTRYGNGLSTGLYKKAIQFRKTFPTSYAGDVKKAVEDIIQNFKENPYTCSSRADILKEYRLFIKTFPKDRNTPAVRAALKTVEKKKDLYGRHWREGL